LSTTAIARIVFLTSVCSGGNSPRAPLSMKLNATTMTTPKTDSRIGSRQERHPYVRFG